MRSLFHFPLPCTTTLAVTVSYSNRPTAARNVPSPASCTHAPPAPLPSVAFRRPPAPPVPRLPRSGPRPTVTRSQGARHAAPPSLPRAAARSHRAPSPEYRPAAACTASPASRPPRAAIRIPLCRHRADPALIAPHHDHRAPPPSYTCCASPSASRPPCADIRVTPPISLLALRRPQGPGRQEPRRMHPFFAECAKKAPFLATSARNACSSRSEWQHPRPMHPFPGAIGRFRIHGARILPPRALFRVEEPEITHGAKMLPAPRGLSAAAACGPAERALRPAAAACGPAERALRPAARAWPACRMRPPLPSCLCPPRPAPPRHLARVHRRRLTRAALRRPRPATRSPYRCISLPARRTHPASRAHPPRPGNKRNNANNSMRA